MKLGIIVVSTRRGRAGEPVADWANQVAAEHGAFDEIDLIDLREVNLPLFSEPFHPVSQKYESDDAKNWSKRISTLDAVLFVTPEYDYFTPASLVNAIDYLSVEWAYKPAAFISYGGISGGLRSVQSVKPLLTTVKIMPIPEGVSFHFVANSITDDKLQVTDSQQKAANTMLDELARWTGALKPLRG